MLEEEESRPCIQGRPIEWQERAAAERVVGNGGAERGGGGRGRATTLAGKFNLKSYIIRIDSCCTKYLV